MTMRRRALATSVLGLALVGSLPGPASAAVITAHQGQDCTGSQVLRCAYVNLDTTNNRVRAYATVRDVAGGSNYDVGVSTVWIDEYSAGRWVERSFGSLASDGFRTTSDSVSSDLVTCAGGVRSYRVRMEAQWRLAGNTSNGTLETRTSKTYTC